MTQSIFDKNTYELCAIKFSNGTYYSGCNKQDAKTLVGAQLYRSKKVAKSTIEKSINFPSYRNYTFVSVTLSEGNEI